MSGWRKIVVDDVEYKWKYGSGTVLVRHDNASFAKFDTTKLLGLTEWSHERAIHKRTLNCAVTPGIVADAIRTVRNGDHCASRRT